MRAFSDIRDSHAQAGEGEAMLTTAKWGALVGELGRCSWRQRPGSAMNEPSLGPQAEYILLVGTERQIIKIHSVIESHSLLFYRWKL